MLSTRGFNFYELLFPAVNVECTVALMPPWESQALRTALSNNVGIRDGDDDDDDDSSRSLRCIWS